MVLWHCEHSWALMSTQKRSFVHMSTDDHDAKVHWALMRAYGAKAPYSFILRCEQECLWMLMSAYYCSWVLMSIDEYSWACFHVTVSTHESSWAVMSIVPCGHEHSLALMGTIGDIALYLWMLMSAHRRKKGHKRAPKSSWEFISVEVLDPKINKKCYY